MHRGTAPEIAGDVLPQEVEVDVIGIESVSVSFLWAFPEAGREH